MQRWSLKYNPIIFSILGVATVPFLSGVSWRYDTWEWLKVNVSSIILESSIWFVPLYSWNLMIQPYLSFSSMFGQEYRYLLYILYRTYNIPFLMLFINTVCLYEYAIQLEWKQRTKMLSRRHVVINVAKCNQVPTSGLEFHSRWQKMRIRVNCICF